LWLRVARLGAARRLYTLHPALPAAGTKISQLGFVVLTTTGFGQMTENHINGFLWWKSIPREKFS
jgi:hypothetical protein